jgi:hypothetical protein
MVSGVRHYVSEVVNTYMSLFVCCFIVKFIEIFSCLRRLIYFTVDFLENNKIMIITRTTTFSEINFLVLVSQ